MNILHLKYAVEVEKEGSINKAAETLIMGQPNLSRAIRELETSLGITIFERTAKGMTPTAEGETFLRYAKQILGQIDYVESIYKNDVPVKHKFSVSVPRVSYICDAFAQFSKTLTNEPAEIFYKETNSSRAIKNILQADYKLGIIRYAKRFDSYFKEMLAEKGLTHETITEFQYMVVVGKNSPLAKKSPITFDNLMPYIEIAHADPYVPSLPMAVVKKEELPDNIRRRIYVFERASQFELLTENPDTFMWLSPLSDKQLNRYGLVQKKSIDNSKVYKDVLIYRDDYRLSDLDKRFIDEVFKSKQKYL